MKLIIQSGAPSAKRGEERGDIEEVEHAVVGEISDRITR